MTPSLFFCDQLEDNQLLQEQRGFAAIKICHCSTSVISNVHIVSIFCSQLGAASQRPHIDSALTWPSKSKCYFYGTVFKTPWEGVLSPRLWVIPSFRMKPNRHDVHDHTARPEFHQFLKQANHSKSPRPFVPLPLRVAQ